MIVHVFGDLGAAAYFDFVTRGLHQNVPQSKSADFFPG